MSSYINNQIFLSVIFLCVGILIFLLPSRWISKERWGCFGTILILCCVFNFFSIVTLSYFAKEVVGTTKGISYGLKTTKSIKYTFEHKGKHYSGANGYDNTIKLKGGRYIVRVSDFIFITSWMDFSRPVD